MSYPRNIIVRRILVTDLSQQLKKQRDFLRWMGRRYAPVNPDQAAAFNTGGRLIDELRSELLEGLFDAGEEEVFTEELAGDQEIHLQELKRRRPAADTMDPSDQKGPHD